MRTSEFTGWIVVFSHENLRLENSCQQNQKKK